MNNQIIPLLLDNLGPIILGLVLICDAAFTVWRRVTYAPVKGRCISVTSKWFQTKDTSSLGMSGKYAYIYQGKYYKVQDKSFLTPCKITVGEEYQLYVNPRNPNNFITAISVKYAILFFLSGLLLIIVAPVLF